MLGGRWARINKTLIASFPLLDSGTEVGIFIVRLRACFIISGEDQAFQDLVSQGTPGASKGKAKWALRTKP